MDLREFLSATLVQIAQGARAAADEVGTAGGIVNPALAGGAHSKGGDGYLATLDTGAPVFLVEFDVAITVSDEKVGAAGAKGGMLSVFSANAEGRIANASESVSRVRFRVPLALGVDSATAAQLQKHRRDQDVAVRSFTPISPL